ncbi:lysophospholipid acyltransferase family protein [Pseudodesulfovibrio sediminis]|uniref:Lipid A biosynthesis acyltransferase n=1 Tax=Pseudodesulfovibrio sediminis TaxID=2810563 RepID=A0ABM7P6A0_9BACT|nr:lysophospholipid acyltransferase family protein [Pseudodesulfovibrio sediminis]BCS88449.1 hypothetical protein PSDVSF_16910 [Pseudodesulfovibrio sediminis]
MAGRPLAYCMLFFVVPFYTLRPNIRRRSAEYRRRRFGDRGALGQFVDCFKLHMEFGKMLVDRAVMGILGQFSLDASPEDFQTLVDLAAQGRGLILITGHVGCWQLGMSVLNKIDGPKAIVMYNNRKDVDKHYYEHDDGNEHPGFSIIDPRSAMGGTLEMMTVLKQAGLLCIMGDRSFGSTKNVVDVDFMGGTIPLPISAYKLASNLNVPIVVTFSHRTGAGYGRIWISRVIDVPENMGRNAQIYQPYAQCFAKGLEEFTEHHPWQFYNFYNMWEKEE